jgi:bacillithiol system protein YtxJ
MWFRKEEKNNGFAWRHLTNTEQLNEWIEKSNETPVLLFKHSTRCPVSMMAKRRLEIDWNFTTQELVPVYLDLIAYRTISNKIEEHFGVVHQSPQVLVIKNGKCVYHASHESIEAKKISASL